MKTQFTALLVFCLLSFRSFSQTNTHTIILVDRSVSFPSPPTSLLSTVIAKYFTQRYDIFQVGAFHGSSSINNSLKMDYKPVDANLGKDDRDLQEMKTKKTWQTIRKNALKQAKESLSAKVANANYTMIAQAIAEATHKFAKSTGYRKVLVIATDLEQTSPEGSLFRNLKRNPPRTKEQAETMAKEDAKVLKKEINEAGTKNLNILLWSPDNVGRNGNLLHYRTYWETLLNQVGIENVCSDGTDFELKVKSFQPNFMEE